MNPVDPEPRSKRKAYLRWCLGLMILMAGSWLLWSATSYAATMRMYMIPTASMAPTLAVGDRVCAELHPSAPPARGEIWVFRMPKTNLTIVKRVIGLPGETIEVSKGKVWIDGEALTEAYLCTPPSYTMPPVKLGKAEYFMLGDSRNVSNDSHKWGPVSQDLLIGRAVYRYWPMKRIGGL